MRPIRWRTLPFSGRLRAPRIRWNWLPWLVVFLAANGAVEGGAGASGVRILVVAGTLVRGPAVAVTPSTFWSVAGGPGSYALATDPAVQQFLNGTPIEWIRYGGAADECNLTSDTLYGTNGSVARPCPEDLTAFAAWCDSRGPDCRSIVQLPGENNDSAEDAYFAEWILDTVGFRPDYWAIGNEPLNWHHYGQPWTDWTEVDNNSSPTPLAYAIDLRNAISAIREVEPTARFVGVEAASANATGYRELLGEVARIDGPNISAIAYHSYPNPGRTSPSPAEAYALLDGPANISSTYAVARAAITGLCAACSSMPIFVNEFNLGPPGGSALSQSYPDALFLAATVAEALRANVSQFTVFDAVGYPWGLVDSNGTVNPTGTLYADVFADMVLGTVYPTELTSGPPGFYSVLTDNGTGGSLLMVNTQLAAPVTVGLTAVVPSNRSTTLRVWASGEAVPTVTPTSAPSAVIIPAQGLVLLSWSGAGLPSGAGGAGPAGLLALVSAVTLAGVALAIAALHPRAGRTRAGPHDHRPPQAAPFAEAPRRSRPWAVHLVASARAARRSASATSAAAQPNSPSR